ncbi:hypothetical protein F5Y11DRAFT_343766 [Daldinia sp. FL1419]|nr:hypothetical protein F5Y11DRAFT_343766 [Daldinia sp. FL1419]
MTCSHAHCSRPASQTSNYPRIVSNQACPSVDMSGTAPGKRCPTCQSKGQEVWVLPGRDCPYCGTYVA